jgi:hypothetical protein
MCRRKINFKPSKELKDLLWQLQPASRPGTQRALVECRNSVAGSFNHIGVRTLYFAGLGVTSASVPALCAQLTRSVAMDYI